jgi:thiol-disulfide isomerase/thioredoxin
MRLRSGLLVVLAGLLAGVLGLAASVAVYGPGPLLASPLGQMLDRVWPSSGDGVLAIGDVVQPWSLPNLEGARATLPLSGQATLINYWASWCGPCREELPLLAELSRDAKAGLAVRAIALDSPEEARRFLTGQRLQLPTPIETPGPQDSSIRLGNRASVLPFSVLVDGQGRLRARKTGAFHSRAELNAWIEQGLAPP